MSGTVSVYKKNIENNEQLSTIRGANGEAKHIALGSLVNIVSAGDCIGERHVMQHQPRSASAVARDEVQLLVICAQRFKEIVEATEVTIVAQPEACKHVLHKGFISRTPDDINLLMSLAESSTFLSQFSMKERRLMCRYLKFRAVTKGNVLFHQGDLGARFYVITAGQAIVYHNKSVIHVKDQNTIGSIIATLGVGNSFGEQALMEQGSLRNATIVASKETTLELAFLELPAFLSLIRENKSVQTLSFQEAKEKRELAERKVQLERDKVSIRDALQSNLFSFFDSWSKVLRDSLAAHTELVRIEGGGRVVLAKQEAPMEYLFLLLKGTFERTWSSEEMRISNSRRKTKKEEEKDKEKDDFTTTARKGKQRTTSKLLRANSIFGEYEMYSTQSKYIFGLATSNHVVLQTNFFEKNINFVTNFSFFFDFSVCPGCSATMYEYTRSIAYLGIDILFIRLNFTSVPGTWCRMIKTTRNSRY